MISPRCQVENKNLGAIGPGSCAEFWCGSCCDSHLSWRHHICKQMQGGVETHSKTPTRETQIQGLKYIHCYDKGSWNDTRQYTFLWQRILKLYQAISFLTTEDPEIIQGNILSYDRGSWDHTRHIHYYGKILKSYQAHTLLRQRILKPCQTIYFLLVKDPEIIPGIYFLKTEDPEIIPGNIHAHGKGSWNHTRQYTFL